MNEKGAGEVGTICARKLSEEAGKENELLPRKKDACKAELCCGSANKYLRDGTRLTVETCQERTTSTFVFYPALTVGAVDKPATENWHFYCIEGA